MIEELQSLNLNTSLVHLEGTYMAIFCALQKLDGYTLIEQSLPVVTRLTQSVCIPSVDSSNNKFDL